MKSRSAAELWRNRLEDFARRGMPVADFCAVHGVSTASFYSWRRKLASTQTSAPAPTFVELAWPPPSAPASFPDFKPASGCIIELSSPTRLHVPSKFDPAAVRALLLVLKEVQC